MKKLYIVYSGLDSDTSLVFRKFIQRVKPLCVDKNAVMIPNRWSNSFLKDKILFYWMNDQLCRFISISKFGFGLDKYDRIMICVFLFVQQIYSNNSVSFGFCINPAINYLGSKPIKTAIGLGLFHWKCVWLCKYIDLWFDFVIKL